MARQFVFTMLRLNKSYGAKQVLKNINLCFFPGAKIGVVGDNGSGKSTLLRIMAGTDNEFEGEAFPEKGVRVGMVPQEPHLDPELTVREIVEGAFQEIKALLKEYDEVTEKMAGDLSEDEMEKAMDRMSKLQDAIEAANGWELDRAVDAAADALVLPPDDQKAPTLSGGERRRVALCRALLEKPDILLLDEPTNHLDAETVQWLEEQLREYPGAVLIVTHDRYFLDNITKWILELEGGRGIPFEGNYTSWLEQKIAAMAQQEKKESERRQSLEREYKWIKMSSRDRHEMTHARVKEYEQLVARERAINENATVIEIPAGQRLGDHVLTFNNVTKGYGGNTLIKDLTFNLPRGAVVGVVGPNGAGKTTLFRMIVGEEKPDAGEVSLGETAQLAYVDQHRDDLNGANTVWQEISDGQDDIMLGDKKVPSRNYVSRFNFKGSDQQKMVGDLSGGERNRVHLAKLIRRGGNVLLLDEPTNDLDVNALRMLEDALNAYTGCAMVISHDRFFLDRVCTNLLVFEGDGKVQWFEGNFKDYEDRRRAALGDKAFANRRSKYRKLAL
ncbi:MAG: energy-dependent translational throttle protein EttA [Candidatus Sumerlaeota bacterium]|nr:energy-dependent translational throttle protein EttA [Candidatus Sumerlaeota bacterium]